MPPNSSSQVHEYNSSVVFFIGICSVIIPVIIFIIYMINPDVPHFKDIWSCTIILCLFEIFFGSLLICGARWVINFFFSINFLKKYLFKNSY